jgi:hypothetical protein
MTMNEPVKEAGSNGPNPEMDETKLKGWLNTGDFDGAFQSAGIPSAIDKFVERGDKVEDLLLRGHFRSVAHMNATVRLFRKSVHFHDNELKEFLLNHIAGYPAIGGARIEILLKAVVGQLSAEKEKKNSRLRNILMGNQEDKKHDNSQ